MAAMTGCSQHLVGASALEVAAVSRASSSNRASTATSVCCGPVVRKVVISKLSLRSSLGLESSSFRGVQLLPVGRLISEPVRSPGVARAGADCDHGADPEFNDSDYIVLGLAHCFTKDADQKLVDSFIIEPIPAGGLECMEHGGVTCYKHAHGTTLGVALKQDWSLLPPQFHGNRVCEDFDFRVKCASRTWKRDHAKEFLMNLVPRDGVRSDWNFSLEDKRILNMENVVSDEDNIKQDISIDVYGRTAKEEEIEKMYNA